MPWAQLAPPSRRSRRFRVRRHGPTAPLPFQRIWQSLQVFWWCFFETGTQWRAFSRPYRLFFGGVFGFGFAVCWLLSGFLGARPWTNDRPGRRVHFLELRFFLPKFLVPLCPQVKGDHTESMPSSARSLCFVHLKAAGSHLPERRPRWPRRSAVSQQPRFPGNFSLCLSRRED